MLTGPVPATEKILADSGMAISDIDLFEVNEAFSAVVLRFMQAFDVDHDRVNVNGGAIAMGHPLGATGAIILGTLLDELERTGKGTGLATLCVASAWAPPHHRARLNAHCVRNAVRDAASHRNFLKHRDRRPCVRPRCLSSEPAPEKPCRRQDRARHPPLLPRKGRCVGCGRLLPEYGGRVPGRRCGGDRGATCRARSRSTCRTGLEVRMTRPELASVIARRRALALEAGMAAIRSIVLVIDAMENGRLPITCEWVFLDEDGRQITRNRMRFYCRGVRKAICSSRWSRWYGSAFPCPPDARAFASCRAGCPDGARR
jgi:hypothetical protein